MNIDKLKHQHMDIHACIVTLRNLAKGGIVHNAEEISKQIVAMSSIIKLHLAVEDKILYPALQRSGNAAVAGMGEKYQREMEGIASAYVDFARRWNTAVNVAQKPEEFRADANRVLKVLHGRMSQEESEFYPAVEKLGLL